MVYLHIYLFSFAVVSSRLFNFVSRLTRRLDPKPIHTRKPLSNRNRLWSTPSDNLLANSNGDHLRVLITSRDINFYSFENIFMWIREINKFPTANQIFADGIQLGYIPGIFEHQLWFINQLDCKCISHW